MRDAFIAELTALAAADPRIMRGHRPRVYFGMPRSVRRGLPPIEELIALEPEWAEWYALAPRERWEQSQRLWATYRALGGSLEPEPDSQSPFDPPDPPGPMPRDGRAGLRLVRRGGV